MLYIADRLCEAEPLRPEGRPRLVCLSRRQAHGRLGSHGDDRGRAGEEGHIIPPNSTPKKSSARLLGAMATKATGFGDKIAQRASDIDLVMINGYGFPVHKGAANVCRGKGEGA